MEGLPRVESGDSALPFVSHFYGSPPIYGERWASPHSDPGRRRGTRCPLDASSVLIGPAPCFTSGLDDISVVWVASFHNVTRNSSNILQSGSTLARRSCGTTVVWCQWYSNADRSSADQRSRRHSEVRRPGASHIRAKTLCALNCRNCLSNTTL